MADVGVYMELIVAFDKKFGIGKNGKIPWVMPSDMAHFKEHTQNSIVVMGRKTWESLPPQNRPLKNRLNIIVSSTPEFGYDSEQVIFTPIENLENVIRSNGDKYNKCMVIGGTRLYEWALPKADRLRVTYIEEDYECDTFFPVDGHFAAYRLEDASKRDFCEIENCAYRFLTYKNTFFGTIEYAHDEYEYLRMLESIIRYGSKRDDRTGTGTIAVFAKQLRFDISDGIVPLITTKYVGWKSVLRELLWFLKGKTDSKELEAKNVNIWRDNSSREFLDKRGLTDYREGDIGPMYFFNVFHYGAEYKGCDADYEGQGFDQMARLIEGIKTDPYSRRHMLTTYNPVVVDKSVLAPCHGIVIQFYVDGSKGENLSCHMYQRSMDCGLGACWNFASYAMLTHIIAEKVGKRAKELIISTGDTHIYSNHVEPLTTQLGRKPYPFPKLMIDPIVKEKSFEELEESDFDLVGYFSHPTIKMPMAV